MRRWGCDDPRTCLYKLITSRTSANGCAGWRAWSSRRLRLKSAMAAHSKMRKHTLQGSFDGLCAFQAASSQHSLEACLLASNKHQKCGSRCSRRIEALSHACLVWKCIEYCIPFDKSRSSTHRVQLPVFCKQVINRQIMVICTAKHRMTGFKTTTGRSLRQMQHPTVSDMSLRWT